jgi:hypothetical protein
MSTKPNPFAGRLSDEDAQLFYKLWMGLLNYVNQAYGVDESLGTLTSPAEHDIGKLIPIRDKLWSETTAISEYVFNYRKHLSEEETAILNGWKQAVAGNFIAMKHLKNYSVLMTTEASPFLYGTVGIMSKWEDMIPKEMLPVTVNCVLLPFKGAIIYDSFLRGGNIRYGSSYKKGLNDAYRSSKEQYGIITSLDDVGDLMKRHTAANERHRRILEDILVDTYDEQEQIAAWHSHLTDTLAFPLEAECDKQMLCSPLLPGEQITVTGLAKESACRGGIAIIIKWQDRKFAVPLEQLKLKDTSSKASESVEDWKYWVSAGCFC